ncbi:TIR domain-containing protein [Solirubrobacter ginsenosidimutans]|uniref:TIR domain-containing protein n=1 Tax=Solirubrobacter ginsenosidimutans TaxID=490573 RepID=A0A9X3N4U0_9ACTN|nr:TIR domain-containing protein [Solirubrobacter ginsenosidimutans]MDA0167030.1 TIR domain-containing protein [Solirubrobacter ginsenosidimutans]
MTGETEGGSAAVGAWQWDVALSFAGSQREYVEQVAAALKATGVSCFYDADEQIDMWGKYLAEELPAIYSERAATVVVFVSADYAARDWTRHERRAALNRAVRERREYVLPAAFDDTPLPGLLSDMVAIDLRRRTPQQFAVMVAEKLATLGITARPLPANSGARPIFRREELAGARVLKVAKDSGKVALCTLHGDGSLLERWLPLSPDDAATDGEVRDGGWSVVEEGRLQIVVGNYWLHLSADPSGLHRGVEALILGRVTVRRETFAAVLVDPRPLPTAEAWMAMKLGERGVRRSLVCWEGGALDERHLFRADTRSRPGTWKAGDRDLVVRVGKWTLTTRPYRNVPGVWLGTERTSADGPDDGFALVRYAPTEAPHHLLPSEPHDDPAASAPRREDARA